MGGSIRTNPQIRFWAMVSKGSPDKCWPWTGFRGRKGYGHFSNHHFYYGGKFMHSHRWAWEYTYGEVPKDLQVCHKCDNPPCCNPNHLFLGTNSDNQQDSFRKGRVKIRGEYGRNRKLTKEQVEQIRSLPECVTGKAIARMFSIGASQVSRIKNNQSWV